MKKFVFKLENVLKYRETLESMAKNAYRDALQVLNLERNKMLELQNRRDALKMVFNLQAGSVADSQSLIFAARYSAQLAALIEIQRKIILEKEKTVKQCFEEWNARRKDVKVIRRLEEKKKQEYLKEADKEEQKFQDEIFISKKARENVE